MRLQQELAKIIQQAYQSGIYNADDLATYIIKSGIILRECVIYQNIFGDD